MTYNGHTTIITRSENIQKEVKEGLETVLNVKWIDDCTFTLTPTNDTFRKMPNVPKDAFVTVEITKVNYNSYKQVCTSNFSDNVITGEVFKINE